MDDCAINKCSCRAEPSTCTNTSIQYADVRLPIKLKPYAVLENLEVECCGEPSAILQQNSECGCLITVMQTVCIKIPVKYGVSADVGDISVSCKRNLDYGHSLCRK